MVLISTIITKTEVVFQLHRVTSNQSHQGISNKHPVLFICKKQVASRLLTEEQPLWPLDQIFVSFGFNVHAYSSKSRPKKKLAARHSFTIKIKKYLNELWSQHIAVPETAEG